jgi:hypothetical protein
MYNVWTDDGQIRRVTTQRGRPTVPASSQSVSSVERDAATAIMSDENPADAFDEVPIIEHPTAQERAMARAIYPPHRVPDDGPVPDPTYHVEVGVTVDVPGWVAESVEYHVNEAPGKRDVEDVVADE